MAVGPSWRALARLWRALARRLALPVLALLVLPPGRGPALPALGLELELELASVLAAPAEALAAGLASDGRGLAA
jgi:hypothetical protein